jgi:hypothetical protein
MPSGWYQIAVSGQVAVWGLDIVSLNMAPASVSGTFLATSNSNIGVYQIAQSSGYDVAGITTTSNTTSIIAPTVTPTKESGETLLSYYISNSNGIITGPAGQSLIFKQSQTGWATGAFYETLAAATATNTVTSNNTNVSNNDTVTVQGRVYTFKTALTPAEGEVLIGANADASLLNLAHAINGTGGTPGTDYQVATANAFATSSAVTSHAITLTARASGTAANAWTLAKSAATLTVGGATFSGGTADPAATGTRTATSAGSNSNCIGINIALFPSPPAITPTSPGGPMLSPLSSPGVNSIKGFATYPLPMMRPIPTWLVDFGVGVDSSAGGSVNITQRTGGYAQLSSDYGLLSVDVLGSLSGTVTISGVPLQNCLVLLGYRPIGCVIKTTRTAANGTYSFTGLDRTAISDNSYYVVAVDPNGNATQYNSLIWDREVPS